MRDRFDREEEITREEALELVKRLWNRVFSAARSSPSLLTVSYTHLTLPTKRIV